MMDWGNAEADKRGLVSYIDATILGKELYSKCGYVQGERREFLRPDMPRTPQLDALTEQLLPFEWWPMFRPVNGKLEGAEIPWTTQ